MVIKLTPQSTVLPQDDSITASGRREDPDGALGDGYARLAAELIRAAHPRARPPSSTGAPAETAGRTCGSGGTRTPWVSRPTRRPS
jgi:hypothetical protein